MTIDWERVLAVLLLGLGTWVVLSVAIGVGVGIWIRLGRRVPK